MSGFGVDGDEPSTDDQDEPTAAVATLYATVEDWVEDFFAPAVVRRSSNEFLWCPSWWAHQEVVIRLTGLWATWETARGGTPVDMNTWWLQELGPHLRELTAANGPMNGCNQSKGHSGSGRGLVVLPPPPGTFGPP